MSVYFNLFFRKKKSLYKKTDEVSVQVYYYFNKKKLNISTGVYVKLKDWDENWKKKQSKNPIKKSDKNFLHKNLIIKQKVKEVEDILLELSKDNEIPLVDLVKSKLNKNYKKREVESFKNVEFTTLLDEYKQFTRSRKITEGTKRTFYSNINKIIEFTNEFKRKVDYRLTQSDIDDDFQNSFLDYLSETEQPSTIKKRFSVLSSIINWSVKNNYLEHPIQLISFTSQFDKVPLFLKRDELLKLYEFNEFNYQSPKHQEYTETYIDDFLKNDQKIKYTNFEVYRDMLVFGSGLGCRFGDLVNLKIDNYEFSKNRTQGFFVFRMGKSKIGKQVRVPINKLTFEIWKKYSKNKLRSHFIFPRSKTGTPISNQKFNKNIKTIGKIVGLNRLVNNPKFDIHGNTMGDSDIRKPLYNSLTSHIMRKTFIREGININLPTHVLMSMSGHTTERIFRKYFSTQVDELTKGGKKMFSLELIDNNSITKGEVKHFTTPQLSVEDELTKLKSLFEKGLIPKDIYDKKILDLL